MFKLIAVAIVACVVVACGSADHAPAVGSPGGLAPASKPIACTNPPRCASTNPLCLKTCTCQDPAPPCDVSQWNETACKCGGN